MMVDDASSETAPLLGSNSRPSPDSSRAQGNITASPEEAGDVESNNLARTQSVDSNRAAQYQGNAEVQKQLKYIVPAVSIGVFLAAADQTIIVSSYGRIGSELDALNLTSWIATSYFLTLTSFQPLYGKLSDIFGRKACLLYAYAIFGLGCLFCGLSQSINQLIAARVFQGIGGGGMTTVVSIMFSDIIPLKDRGVWQGIINIIYAAGAGSGAPLGGLLADTIGWRWSFLAQAPLCAIAFLAVGLVLQLPQADTDHWRQKLRRVDFVGALVLVAAVFTLIFGMDRGSNTSWSHAISYGPLIISVFLFFLFIVVERHVAAEPFAPGHIIFHRTLFPCYLCNFFSFGGWLAVLYYLPLFYQAVDGYSATGAAVRLLPAITCGVSGSLFGGIWMRKTGKYYWLTVFAYTLLAVGMLLVFLFSGLIQNSTLAITIGTMCCGFGNGIGVTSSLIAIISNASPDDQAVATACSYLFRSLGSVIGISLSSTVIQQRLRDTLARELGSGKDAAQIERGVRRSLDYLKKLQPSIQKIVRLAYGDAVTCGYGFMLAIALGATIASLFIRERRLSK
ncbi:hypothetical protein B0A52_04395 [Exophiala mesophila]|uniref:Major facilitator superfamily (MFS) profile domain-containing protein n=1 Tax=Exophiala mesophila TaxID=212818 RepID=A0A438N991_EXOME|nr:hypothetical protein B0A52_04395 [Exophiala mesophila]